MKSCNNLRFFLVWMVEGQTREIGAGSFGPMGALITRNVIESSVIFAGFFALWDWDSGGRKGEGRAFPFSTETFRVWLRRKSTGLSQVRMWVSEGGGLKRSANDCKKQIVGVHGLCLASR